MQRFDVKTQRIVKKRTLNKTYTPCKHTNAHVHVLYAKAKAKQWEKSEVSFLQMNIIQNNENEFRHNYGF